MLLIVEEGIRAGICHAFHRYAQANNKYIKDYDKNKDSSYLKCWDANNSYGWAMSQKLSVNDFKCVQDVFEFNEDFRKSYNDDCDEGYFLEDDVQYRKSLHNLHDDLTFLTERMKIEKVGKLLASLHNKAQYVIHIRNLKKSIKSMDYY